MTKCKKVARRGANVLRGGHRLIRIGAVPWGDLRCLLEPKSLIYLFFCVYRLRKRTLSVPGGKEKEVNPQRSD